MDSLKKVERHSQIVTERGFNGVGVGDGDQAFARVFLGKLVQCLHNAGLQFYKGFTPGEAKSAGCVLHLPPGGQLA